jgi:hypothetical protein
MPYIKKERRKEILTGMEMPSTPGELNFVLITIILEYLKYCKACQKDEKNHYEDFNEVIGVLSCISQELYRRVVVPYENEKIEENGDVF